MNTIQLATAAVYLELLAAEATKRAGEFRAQIRTDAVERFRADGGAPTWRFDGVGTVSLAVSKESVQITDPAVFLAWVARNYPDEIVTRREVRSSWQTAFLERVRQETDTEVVADPETGEVIPGVVVKPGGEPKHLTIRPDPDAKAMLGLAAAEGLKRIAADSGPVVLAELEASG